MARRFNPPPGWPIPPEGWRPSPDWNPDPSWPAAPPDWPFWVDEDEEPLLLPIQPMQPMRSAKKRRGALPYVGVALVLILIGVVAGNALRSNKPDQGASGISDLSQTDQPTTVAAVPQTSDPTLRSTPRKSKPKATATSVPTSSPARTRTPVTSPPKTTRVKVTAPRTTKPKPKPPIQTSPVRTKPPTKSPPTTPSAPPTHRIVIPGSFCADAEAGDIGYSAKGNRYRCSIYPNGRYRWKRD
jgi:hypothetical protein